MPSPAIRPYDAVPIILAEGAVQLLERTLHAHADGDAVGPGVVAALLRLVRSHEELRRRLREYQP